MSRSVIFDVSVLKNVLNRVSYLVVYEVVVAYAVEVLNTEFVRRFVEAVVSVNTIVAVLINVSVLNTVVVAMAVSNTV